MAINYIEKGYGLHEAIAAAGHYLANVDGEWQSDNDEAVQKIIDEYQPPIKEEQAKAFARISTWRDREEHVEIIIDYEGKRWDAGLASQRRLDIIVALPALPEDFFWTDADNIQQQVTLDFLKALRAQMNYAMAAQGFKIHERQTQMKAEVRALTDIEEIQNYQPSW